VSRGSALLNVPNSEDVEVLRCSRLTTMLVPQMITRYILLKVSELWRNICELHVEIQEQIWEWIINLYNLSLLASPSYWEHTHVSSKPHLPFVTLLHHFLMVGRREYPELHSGPLSAILLLSSLKVSLWGIMLQVQSAFRKYLGPR
jgi:hypothetical protein